MEPLHQVRRSSVFNSPSLTISIEQFYDEKRILDTSERGPHATKDRRSQGFRTGFRIWKDLHWYFPLLSNLIGEVPSTQAPVIFTRIPNSLLIILEAIGLFS